MESSGGTPEMLRFVHMDPAGAVVVANLSLLGLLGRERFGQPCHLHTSHFAMGIAMQTNRAGESSCWRICQLSYCSAARPLPVPLTSVSKC